MAGQSRADLAREDRENKRLGVLSPLASGYDTPKKSTIGDKIRSFLGTRIVGYPKPTPTPTPMPSPTPTPMPERYFDYRSVANFPEGVEVPPQPPKSIADILWRYFPSEATQSAISSKYEGHWNPSATSPLSPGGTIDRGLFQVSTQGTNPGTFEDLMKRKSGRMKSVGVTNVNDLYDPAKNAQVMGLIREEERFNKQIPFRRTYGWQNQGITWK